MTNNNYKEFMKILKILNKFYKKMNKINFFGNPMKENFHPENLLTDTLKNMKNCKEIKYNKMKQIKKKFNLVNMQKLWEKSLMNRKKLNKI